MILLSLDRSSRSADTSSWNLPRMRYMRGGFGVTTQEENTSEEGEYPPLACPDVVQDRLNIPPSPALVDRDRTINYRIIQARQTNNSLCGLNQRDPLVYLRMCLGRRNAAVHVSAVNVFPRMTAAVDFVAPL